MSKLVSLFVLLAVLLVSSAASYKSVKEYKPQTEEEAMAHHHYHRRHRRGEADVHSDKTLRIPEQHELDLAAHLEKHGNDGGHRHHSPHPKHRVGPQYPDHSWRGHSSRKDGTHQLSQHHEHHGQQLHHSL